MATSRIPVDVHLRGLEHERRDGEVRVIIEDNGQGFDRDAGSDAPDAARKIGLKGMEERAIQAGEQFDIETAPGKGTTILCTHSASY